MHNFTSRECFFNEHIFLFCTTLYQPMLMLLDFKWDLSKFHDNIVVECVANKILQYGVRLV